MKKENEQVTEPIQSGSNQQIVNTDAAKAKVNDLVGKAKGGVEYYTANIKTDKRLMIGTAIAVVVVVLLGVLLFSNPSKSIAKKYAEAMLEGDAEIMMSILHEDYIEYIEDNLPEYTDYDDAEEMFEEIFDERKDEDIEYLSYEITDVKTDYDKDDVEDVADHLNELYDIDEDSVKNVARYTIKFEVEYDGDDETEKEKVFIVKIDGKWYYFGQNVGL